MHRQTLVGSTPADKQQALQSRSPTSVLVVSVVGGRVVLCVFATQLQGRL